VQAHPAELRVAQPEWSSRGGAVESPPDWERRGNAAVSGTWSGVVVACSTRKSDYPCSGWTLRHLLSITLDGTLGAFNPRVVGSIPTGPTVDHVLTCTFSFSGVTL
jgi:hypothetical protein